MSTTQNTQSTTEGPNFPLPSLRRFGPSSSFSQIAPRASVIGHRLKSSVLGFSPRKCSSILMVCHLSSVLCPLIILALLLTLGTSWAADTPIQERLINIDQKAQTFTQVLDAVAEQADISFKTHGDLPQAKRDLTLNQVPLNQAMGHILRLYGVRNHAAAYNAEAETVLLAILETATHVADLSSQGKPGSDYWGGFEPLTQNKLSRLKKQSAIIVAQMEEISKPLTPEQLERLHDESANIEWERNELEQPLTPEQLDRLREQSAEIERVMHNNVRSLTTEQMQRLRDQSSIIKSEMEETKKPLTPEQLERLKEQSRSIESEGGNL